MEEGNLSRLPGGVFTRSFFKQYAAALGLDPAFVEDEIRQISPAPEPIALAQETFVPFESSEPRSKSLTSASIWVVLALVGCGASTISPRTINPRPPNQPNQPNPSQPQPEPKPQ